jgi:hypothetical protein
MEKRTTRKKIALTAIMAMALSLGIVTASAAGGERSSYSIRMADGEVNYSDDGGESWTNELPDDITVSACEEGGMTIIHNVGDGTDAGTVSFSIENFGNWDSDNELTWHIETWSFDCDDEYAEWAATRRSSIFEGSITVTEDGTAERIEEISA